VSAIDTKRISKNGSANAESTLAFDAPAVEAHEPGSLM